MRKANRLWLLAPILGIGAALALPPLDEYAPLDRIGKQYDPAEDWRLSIPPGSTASFRRDLERLNRQSMRMARELDERSGVSRRRCWKVHVSEAGARRTFGRLFSARGRWRRMGTGTGSTSEGRKKSTIGTTAYMNDETSDFVAIVSVTQTAPTRGPTSIKVEVTQAKSSLQPWALFKRWARRIVGR